MELLPFKIISQIINIIILIDLVKQVSEARSDISQIGDELGSLQQLVFGLVSFIWRKLSNFIHDLIKK